MQTKEIISQIAKKNNTSTQEIEKELFYALSFCDRSIMKSEIQTCEKNKTQNIFDDVLKYCVKKFFETLY